MGVFVTLLAVAVSIVVWLNPPSTSNVSATNDVLPLASSTSPNPSQSAPSGEEEVTPPASPPADGSTDTKPIAAPSSIYLKDIPKDAFIHRPYNADRGAVSIGGQTFISSYSFEFENCSSCTQTVEFNIPGSFARFTGVFGLSDNSRHDDVIDGIVYVAVYSITGDLIFDPQKVEYPAQLPFDIDIEGISRIRVEVSGGTNWEDFCLCNALFHQ